ncbi:MAG TPA: response regulator [Ktedonobacteraceae bacterium]|nr:response regulator [Ktedonobacteraceae bacterium]
MAKIVLCEDEINIQKLVRVMLRSSSHELHIAADGVEGLKMIERVHPDLIFTDISMPGRDGYQLADELKARPKLAHIPIVFISAFAQRSMMNESYRHGGASYLTKPFSAADLFEKINLFCKTEIKAELPRKAEIPHS